MVTRCQGVFWPVLLSLLIVLTAIPGSAQTQGSLVGTIFEKDGTTPVTGAVLKLKNVQTGSTVQSRPTDKAGQFAIAGLGTGIYSYGITTSRGDFNASEMIGIQAKEPTKISVALDVYDDDVRAAVQQTIQEQEKKGESRIGRVVQFSPQTKEAIVLIERGALQKNDKIQVKGEKTDFTQDVAALKREGSSVRRVKVGENGSLTLVQLAQIGDSVFVVKKAPGAFFLLPCGLATIIAGTGAVTGGLITITDGGPTSTFKIK